MCTSGLVEINLHAVLPTLHDQIFYYSYTMRAYALVF